jgi:hypothetical protein
MSRRVRVGQRERPNKPNPVKHNKLIGVRGIAINGVAINRPAINRIALVAQGRELRWSRARLSKSQSRERAPRKRS